MRPENLQTKIFLDGGDPKETKTIFDLLGFLDGQTTNPTLIAKNPDAQTRLARGEKFTRDEIFAFYKGVVQEMSALIPDGSVSIEVYADTTTTADAMFGQGIEMFEWISNAHIKYPITSAGLTAAARSIAVRMRVNMTLCFTQIQAAAVYAATKGASKGEVFVSPFVGRLDDRGENGMQLIENIVRMYNEGDSSTRAGISTGHRGHVEVLTASVRTMEHFLRALQLGSDIITAPFAILKAWGENGMPLPDDTFIYDAKVLRAIAYQTLDLTQPWTAFAIAHELTEKGIQRFADDWNTLIAR